jgi:hypothetical protein
MCCCVVFQLFCRLLVFFCYSATFLRLRRECHIHNLLEKKKQTAAILIKIGYNLTCFGPIQSFDLLGWGSHVPRVLSNITKKRWGSHVLRVLSKIEFCALAPDFFIIVFRLPHTQLLMFSMCLKNSFLTNRNAREQARSHTT